MRLSIKVGTGRVIARPLVVLNMVSALALAFQACAICTTSGAELKPSDVRQEPRATQEPPVQAPAKQKSGTAEKSLAKKEPGASKKVSAEEDSGSSKKIPTKAGSESSKKISADAGSGTSEKYSAREIAKIHKLHAIFTNELHKYAHNGLIDYAKWKKNPEKLTSYLDQLGKVTPSQYEKLPRSEQLAIWINAYNAYTIKLVLDNYPIKGSKTYYPSSSIRQIDGFWENNRVDICGRTITLDAMEHDILRRDFFDPRTHFAVVCASKGCAVIHRHAYSGDTLDTRLNESTRRFLSNEKNVKIDFDKKVAHVSMLFKYFPLDFAKEAGLGKRFPPPTDDEIVLTYVFANAPQAMRHPLSEEEKKSFTVEYEPYDWSLNDAAIQDSAADKR